MKVIFPSLFLFFTWAPSTTLGGVFFFVLFGAFGEGMKDWGFLWKNQKVISMCVCMGGTIRY